MVTHSPSRARSIGSMVDLREAAESAIDRRRFVKSSMAATDASFEEYVALIVTVETAGPRPDQQRAVGLAMIAVTYDSQGRVGAVVGTLHQTRRVATRQPWTAGISAEGVCDEATETDFDVGAIEAMSERADLIVAHDATFVRPILERICASLTYKAWACSLKEVAWRRFGYAGASLPCLLVENHVPYRNGEVLIHGLCLLAILMADADVMTSPFSELLASSRLDRVQVHVPLAAFRHRDVLKRRGYQWSSGEDGRIRSWWIEVRDIDLDSEIEWLRCDIYRGIDDDPICRTLTAYDRYRAT